MPPPMVFFDIGATLIDGPSIPPAKFIAARLGITDATEISTLAQILFTSPITTVRGLAAFLSERYRVPLRETTDIADSVWQTQIHGPRAIPGGRELIRSLLSAKIPIGFISNIWHPYAGGFEALYRGVVNRTHVRVYSYSAGYAKPNPDLYKEALRLSERDPRSCIMIGDTYDNDIAPARALGFKTVWVLHRPDKEGSRIVDCETNRLPVPDIICNDIAELTVPRLQALISDAPLISFYGYPIG